MYRHVALVLAALVGLLALAAVAVAAPSALVPQGEGIVTGTTTLTREWAQIRPTARVRPAPARTVARRQARFARVNPRTVQPDQPGEGRTAPPPRAVQNERRAMEHDGFGVLARYPILRGDTEEEVAPTFPVGTTYVVSEPSIANDRQVVMATGNDWAAISDDNARTWEYVYPYSFDQATPGDGFCCDQQVFAVGRGGSAMLVWMLQYYNSTDSRGKVDGQNAQRIVILRGRDALTSLGTFPEAAATCSIVMTPRDFGETREQARLDYPQVSATDRFLYITTRMTDTPSTKDVVVRLSLDELDRADCPSESLAVDRFWVISNANVLTPAQGDPTTGAVMHFATRKSTTFNGDVLWIYSVSDSSDTLFVAERNIENFPDSQGYKCKLDGDRGDPCGFLDSRITTGFRGGPQNGVVGWLWTAGGGQGFPHPNVQVAVFDTEGLRTKVESNLWNPDYAWTYPAAAVNDRGEVAVQLYRMGGAQLPEARVFVVDDPGAPGSWPPEHTTSVRASDDGVAIDRWGDFFTVRSVINCGNSFISGLAAMRGGRRDDDVEISAAYLGRKADACPDLVIDDLDELIADPNNLIEAGDTLPVRTVLTNTGWGRAGQSRI
ncbi:MAG: hypothetical protein MUE51_09570, partial [Thermoleophilia bacterium]|nr:hypothetical protein [Thermoleophilia bacterium]